jgi:hypothetical protein
MIASVRGLPYGPTEQIVCGVQMPRYQDSNLTFLPTEDGKTAANLILEAASRTRDGSILVSKAKTVTLVSTTQDPTRLPKVVSRLQLMIRVPRRTKSVRVVTEDLDSGRIGAADMDRKTIDAAPATPTPEPQLTLERPDHTPTPKQ